MLTVESEVKAVETKAVDSVVPKARKSLQDHVVDICCWAIDAVVKTVTFVISGAILMVGGVIFFVVETIVKIAFFIVMLVITFWVLGALFRIGWMIWGPKNL